MTKELLRQQPSLFAVVAAVLLLEESEYDFRPPKRAGGVSMDQRGLLQYLNNSPTAFHAVENAAEILRGKGFQELKETDAWALEQGGRYFVVKNRSCVIAFTVGKGSLAENGFRIIGAHTDSPCLKIKPEPVPLHPTGMLR